MIIAWTIFVVLCVSAFISLVACIFMAWAYFIDGDKECLTHMGGCWFITMFLVIIASLPAQEIWGGGM